MKKHVAVFRGNSRYTTDFPELNGFKKSESVTLLRKPLNLRERIL